MSLSCNFNFCKWSGDEDEIFDHLETYHKKFLREPRGQLFYDFCLDELQQETFVLCSPNGLYWFRQNCQKPSSQDGINFGVFHIGGSEQVEYTLKIGLKRDGFCEYWGPLESMPDKIEHPDNDDFILSFEFNYLEKLNEIMPSRRLRLYFGKVDDSDDKLSPGPQHIEWTEEDERLNLMCVEMFSCAVCFEYIRRDARFCENSHSICLNCFDKMQERKKLKCPTCRGLYLYDCSDPDIERLLRMIKWPDMPEVKVDKKIEDFVNSLPDVEYVRVKGGENV